jgi:hypothetical protein
MAMLVVLKSTKLDPILIGLDELFFRLPFMPRLHCLGSLLHCTVSAVHRRVLLFLTNHCEATAPQQNFIPKQKSLMYKQELEREGEEETYLSRIKDSKAET